MLRLRDAAGRDRRVHRVHHLELSARAHRARRARGDRHRVPAHAGAGAARARQLRQPAGVVGDAGRQGRAAEPGVRRQRHGQRDDRGERRPRRRRQLLHGRSRDRPQRRGRRLRRQAPQHALRHPRRSDLPRARRAADAGAGDGARRRRHVGARRARQLPGAQRRRQAAARAAARPRRSHDRRTGRRGSCPIDRPPIRDGVGRRRRRTDRRGRRPPGSGRSAAGSRSRPRRAAARPRQRAHASRAVVAARPRAAGAAVHRLDHAAVRASRRHGARPTTRRCVAPIREAIGELRRVGTVAVGDISNSLASVGADARRRGLDGLVFHELLGFNERDGGAGRATREARAAAAAQPASASRSRRTRRTRCRPSCSARFARRSTTSPCPITSVHLGESPEEVELLATAAGRGAACSRSVGAWRDDWQIPGCGPVEYLDRPGRARRADAGRSRRAARRRSLARLAAIGATLVTCPRSNQWVGVGAPPIERFYESGVPVAVGTDSLASVDGSEPVRRAEGDALAGAGRAGARSCSRARRSSARARWASTTSSASLDARQARRVDRGRAARAVSTMWKSIW